jgi:hypothetical protein
MAVWFSIKLRYKAPASIARTFVSIKRSSLYRDAERNGRGSLIIKEIALNGARVYYNYKSDMLIPTKVWEETRHLENQIFDAIPVERLAA